MKKKKTIYLILPIIILVWGFVFYQLFSYFFSSPTYATEKIETKIDIDEIKSDTFSIVANYRDPFLDKKVSVSKPTTHYNTNRSKPKKRTKTLKPPAGSHWPVIQYKGMIKNNNSEKRVGIINIAGKEQLVREGDVLNGVQFLSISKTQIKVSFNKEQKIISI